MSKKIYVAPQVNVVEVEVPRLIAASPDQILRGRDKNQLQTDDEERYWAD